MAWFQARPRSLDAVAAIIVLLGGFIRTVRSTNLSLWLDEGLTVRFSRLRWSTVLGFDGPYDQHPPLYYAVVKAVSQVLPDAVAGRYISVLAGTATLAVLYVLVTRLLGRPAGVVACLVAALSPLEVWYSQEARQYALTGLAVAITYLALVSYYIKPSYRWAVVYGVSVAATAYLDYSGLYALIPQVVVIAAILYRHRRASAPLLIAWLAAVAVFLPWVPNMLDTTDPAGGARATLDSIFSSATSVAGFGGNGVYFYSSQSLTWDVWPGLRGPLALIVILGLGAGGLALLRARFAALIAGCLLAGTFVLAVALSGLGGGLAPRIVSYSVLGWAIVLGAIFAARGLRPPVKAVGIVAVVAIVGVSSVSVRVVNQGAKEEWRGWAHAVGETAHFGLPTVVFPTIAPTFLDIYEPGVLAGPVLHLQDRPRVELLNSFAAGQPALWVASYDLPVSESIYGRLSELGMTRTITERFGSQLSLSLYVRPGATVGNALTINGDFANGGDHYAIDWSIPQTAVSFSPDGSGRALTLANSGGKEVAAVSFVPVEGGRAYNLTFEARSRLASGGMRAFLICLGGGNMLDTQPDIGGATLGPGSDWQSVSFGAICPSGTDHIRIDLRNAGVGDLDLRRVRLAKL